MHTVDIGIGGDDDIVVAQAVDSLLDVEGGLEEVELLVLVDHLAGHPEGVEGLTAQREHRLGLHVANLGD